MTEKTQQQESDALIVTVESLEAELSRLRKENQSRMNDVRRLADEEIASKDSKITGLEEENNELKEQLELLDKLSLEYQIARGTKKMLKKGAAGTILDERIQTALKKLGLEVYAKGFVARELDLGGLEALDGAWPFVLSQRAQRTVSDPR